MDFFYQVRISLADGEYFTRKAIHLDFGKMSLEYNLCYSLFRSDIYPIYQITFLETVSCKSLSYLHHFFQRNPIGRIFNFCTLGFGYKSPFFFPSQKNSCDTNNHKKKHKEYTYPFVDPSVESGLVSFFGNFTHKKMSNI